MSSRLESYISLGRPAGRMVKKAQKLDDPRKWVKSLDLEDTSDIAVPKQLVDQEMLHADLH